MSKVQKQKSIKLTAANVAQALDEEEYEYYNEDGYSYQQPSQYELNFDDTAYSQYRSPEKRDSNKLSHDSFINAA